MACGAKLTVHLECCTAVRPTYSLKGTREAYEEAQARLAAALSELSVTLHRDFGVDVPQLLVNGAPPHQRAAPPLPFGAVAKSSSRGSAAGASSTTPRIGAFEVTFTLADANGFLRRAGILFSKLTCRQWPNTGKLANSLGTVVSVTLKTQPEGVGETALPSAAKLVPSASANSQEQSQPTRATTRPVHRPPPPPPPATARAAAATAHRPAPQPPPSTARASVAHRHGPCSSTTSSSSHTSSSPRTAGGATVAPPSPASLASAHRQAPAPLHRKPPIPPNMPPARRAPPPAPQAAHQFQSASTTFFVPAVSASCPPRPAPRLPPKRRPPPLELPPPSAANEPILTPWSPPSSPESSPLPQQPPSADSLAAAAPGHAAAAAAPPAAVSCRASKAERRGGLDEASLGRALSNLLFMPLSGRTTPRVSPRDHSPREPFPQPQPQPQPQPPRVPQPPQAPPSSVLLSVRRSLMTAYPKEPPHQAPAQQPSGHPRQLLWEDGFGQPPAAAVAARPPSLQPQQAPTRPSPLLPTTDVPTGASFAEECRDVDEAAAASTDEQLEGAVAPSPRGGNHSFFSANPIITRALLQRGWHEAGSMHAADLCWSVP